MRRYPWPAIVVFLGPALVFYCAFIIVPVAMTFFNSLHKLQVHGAAGISYSWVGSTNYLGLVQDDVFHMAVQHSLIWGLVAHFLEIPAALVLAYVLYLKVPFAKFYRLAWYTPILISWIVTGD